MRKNGINRELTPIEGGICAVESFRVGGINVSRETTDLALLFSARKCVSACVFSEGAVLAPAVAACKKHLKIPVKHAVLINGSRANLCVEKGEKTAYSLCWDTARPLKIDREHVLPISVGKIEGIYPAQAFTEQIPQLLQSLDCTVESRQRFLCSFGGRELAYSFMIGGIRCKIGVAYGHSEGANVCVMTTDIRISDEMLQKALSAVAKDTFFLTDKEVAPMDTVCILSDKTAVNYPISVADGDYQKFCFALGEVAKAVCLYDASLCGTSFICRTKGAKSKRAARAVANAVLCAKATDVKRIIGAIHKTGEDVSLCKACFVLESETARAVLFEDGGVLPCLKETEQKILCGQEISLTIDFAEGNYGATAIGNIKY